jgi:carbamoyltransferase
MSLNIIGISAFFHDSACCLLQDGVLKAAVEEERFSRIKADPALPALSLNYCLEQAGITITDIDCIAYYENPQKKLERQLWSGVMGNEPGLFRKLRPHYVEEQIRRVMGYEGQIRFYEHHQSHAASAFFFSGFAESALLTVDGVGEWATTTYGYGRGKDIKLFEEVQFPDSLGLLYSTITSYLGFGVNDGEYKVMGLAPYGQPLYTAQLWTMLEDGPGGQYRLNMSYFDFLTSQRMYSSLLEELFGRPARGEDEPMEQFHQDLARSLQVVLEGMLLKKAIYLHDKTGSENLCMAGGVALNCVANGQVLRKGPFKQLFVQPAANDAGTCMGAAALAHVELSGEAPVRQRIRHVYLGPCYPAKDIDRLLKSTSLHYKDHRGDPLSLVAATAERLARGKVIGWFQGRMEFGPRSLGARSILADPRNPTMRDRINAMVKKREGFRPFAPAVLAHRCREHFDLDHDSPFMLETCEVVSPLDLPAITHVDNSARVQTVEEGTSEKFFALLMAFERLTGCPILLNTSFNIKGEPIVCTPEDALRCFITTDIDCLVLEDLIIDRDDNELELLQFILMNDEVKPSGITHDVYTFV